MKAFVDFYEKEGISPVSQDISDLGKHFRRRGALYRHLGVIPSLVKGRRVLEFGPGSGHNALYTASLEPSVYTLVDGNTVGRERTEALLQQYFPEAHGIEIHQSFIEEYEDERRYDLVVCEGLLPMQEDPVELIQHVSKFVAPGGCLLITCIDPVTYLAELLRRLLSLIVTRPEHTTNEKLAILVPVFSPQLSKIQGMSRPHDEYILDNIIQPFRDRRLFSVNEAIDAVSDLMSTYQTSPQYYSDRRWYKTITGTSSENNQIQRSAFLKDQHNFLDVRIAPVDRTSDENLALVGQCQSVYDKIVIYEDSKSAKELDDIQGHLEMIENDTRTWAPKTADSINDYLNNFKLAKEGSTEFSWNEFSDWFGQGQIYVSFLNDL